MHTSLTSWLLLMLGFGGRFCYLLNLVFFKCSLLLKKKKMTQWLAWDGCNSKAEGPGSALCVQAFLVVSPVSRVSESHWALPSAAEGVHPVMLLLGPSGKCLFSCISWSLGGAQGGDVLPLTLCPPSHVPRGKLHGGCKYWREGWISV